MWVKVARGNGRGCEGCVNACSLAAYLPPCLSSTYAFLLVSRNPSQNMESLGISSSFNAGSM